MWISDPTPVISSTKVSDSGSIRRPKSTCSEPTGIQEYSVLSITLASSARPCTCMNVITPITNATTTVAQPSQWPTLSRRRPPSSRMIAPASGRAMSSQAEAEMPVAVVTGSKPSGAVVIEVPVLELQQVRVVDRGTAPTPEDGHDDRQPDDDLGGRDHHDEERHDHAVEVAVHTGEGDQRQVHRVEHQLHAHEHHDGVAPDQHADRADAEQQRGQ